MRETIFCISCDSRVDKDECTMVCDGCLKLSFSAKAQWISVKDRLPPFGHEVLAHQEGDLYMTHLTDYSLVDDEDPYQWSCEYGRLKNVTHWMPLPSPPETLEIHSND